MDFATVNRAQQILRATAIFEKRAGKATALDVLKNVALHSAKAGKEVGKAGWKGVSEGAKSLEEAGHPLLGLGLKASPFAAGAYGVKKGNEKYQQWKMERAYRQQMGM